MRRHFYRWRLRRLNVYTCDACLARDGASAAVTDCAAHVPAAMKQRGRGAVQGIRSSVTPATRAGTASNSEILAGITHGGQDFPCLEYDRLSMLVSNYRVIVVAGFLPGPPTADRITLVQNATACYFNTIRSGAPLFPPPLCSACLCPTIRSRFSYYRSPTRSTQLNSDSPLVTTVATCNTVAIVLTYTSLENAELSPETDPRPQQRPHRKR
ncbi:hypothetical protein ACLKA7_001270 [Drosophila subpalustris]